MNETFPPITSARFPSDVTSAFLMSKRSSSASYPRQGNIIETFSTLGHHNDLQSSLRRAEKDIHEQVYTPISGCQRPSTQKFVTSNRKLRDYSHSICDDIGDVKNFRKTLFEERARQRGVHLLKNKSSLNLGLSSISFRLLTGSSQAPSLPSAMIDVKIDPLTSAKAKLSKFSMSFDPATKENQRMISGFHGQRLSRESFGVLIRQAMHIVLSIPEVDVIYGTMDVSQDGTFDGREFTRKFFNLGNAARREKYTGMARDSSNYPGNRMMSYMEKESERVERWESERAQGPMTSGEEADGVMEKLRVSSLRWHHIGTIGPVLSRGFEAYLTPFQFKEQIQKSFEVTLSKTEITALIGRYKDDLLKGMYYIDGHKFLGHFKGALHQEAWVSHIEEQKKYGEHRDKVRSKFYTPCTLGDHLGR